MNNSGKFTKISLTSFIVPYLLKANSPTVFMRAAKDQYKLSP